MIVYYLSESQTSFILVSEQITQFYREALENFAQNIHQRVSLTKQELMFGEDESDIADKLVTQFFGV
ncbi:MAG: hypothetical protein GF308_06950 [Candidatus Heimdallarchaeota archaeon]|nr:hypothetical protein [Candidatus Heimdallarchaeota archaeon]